MDAPKHSLKTPVLASILEDRRVGLAVLGAVTVQGAMMTLGLPGWLCPLRHVLGIPCPGCGLSRATLALCRGDWATAFEFHAFAPLIVITLLAIITISLLPEQKRLWIIRYIRHIEHRSRVSVIVLILMMAYWLVRLTIFHDAYLNLIMG